MIKKIFILTLSLLLPGSFTFAETIYLKSGKILEGEIIVRTDKYIKIDVGVGMPITYFLDEIEKLGEVDSKNNLVLPSQNVTLIKHEKQKIIDMLYAFFEYECNVDIDEALSKDVIVDDYDNYEIENARKLIDWDNYEVEPERIFQIAYKMAFNEKIKLITQRNILIARFAAIKRAYEKTGYSRRIEDYKIIELEINDSLDDATVIYANAVKKEGKLRVHKKDGKWLIYRDYIEKGLY